VDFAASSRTHPPKRMNTDRRRSFRRHSASNSPSATRRNESQTKRGRRRSKLCRRRRSIERCCHRATNRRRQHKWYPQPPEIEVCKNHPPKRAKPALSHTWRSEIPTDILQNGPEHQPTRPNRRNGPEEQGRAPENRAVRKTRREPNRKPVTRYRSTI
jgi:hypothetical protein